MNPDYQSLATKIRQLVIKMLAQAGSGHPAGAIDLADIYAVLYFSDLLHLDPQQPENPERDRIIISNGQTCPVLYATLALKGYFPLEELETFRQFDSRLQGHPHHNFSLGTRDEGLRTNLSGLENPAGPLGQGTSFAVGLALGLRHLWQTQKLSRLPKVYCLVGDGELNEGQCWEAFMAAAKFKLNHLTFIIDRNGIQIDGYTEDVMPLEPLKDKLNSFGLLAIDLDGHNHQAIYDALKFDSGFQARPTAIIAHTIPGKDIDFMENQPAWHGKSLDLGDAVQALSELQPHA